MHLAETTHEHAKSSRVFSYEADYEASETQIDWTAEAWQGTQAKFRLRGSIPGGVPASLAEQAVRDAVIAEIDRSALQR